MTIPENEISNAIERLRIYYDTGITKSCDFREKQLRKLYDSLIIYKDSLEDALFKDLHKSKGESYMAETQFVLSEIKYCISNFRNWANPRRVNHSLFSFPFPCFSLFLKYSV